MKLSKECIEAIREYTNKQGNLNRRYGCTLGATEALTNPYIFEKAGLISLEDALGFAEWISDNASTAKSLNGYMYQGKWYTTAQLFQIYQEQKEK